MSILSKFRRHGSPDDALSDEERIARYVYLLNTLPASVIESAHAKAFQDLPREQRREMFEQLRPFMSETEQAAASDDPTVLARLLRRAEERRAERAASGGTPAAAGEPVDARDAVDPRGLLQDSGVMTLVASQFLLSSAVSSYFIQGAGSLDLANQPPWVGETYDPAAAAGTDPSGGGGDVGGGGIDGAGFNGGEFGGGFDGSGFGGGGFNGAGG